MKRISGQNILNDGQLFCFLPRNQVRVTHGHVDVGVAHEFLQFDEADFARLGQPGGEGVPQGMKGHGVEAVAVFRGKSQTFDGKAERLREFWCTPRR